MKGFEERVQEIREIHQMIENRLSEEDFKSLEREMKRIEGMVPKREPIIPRLLDLGAFPLAALGTAMLYTGNPAGIFPLAISAGTRKIADIFARSPLSRELKKKLGIPVYVGGHHDKRPFYPISRTLSAGSKAAADLLVTEFLLRHERAHIEGKDVKGLRERLLKYLSAPVFNVYFATGRGKGILKRLPPIHEVRAQHREFRHWYRIAKEIVKKKKWTESDRKEALKVWYALKKILEYVDESRTERRKPMAYDIYVKAPLLLLDREDPSTEEIKATLKRLWGEKGEDARRRG